MKRYTLTVTQAAERLGVTPKVLYRMAERREIAHLRTCGSVSQRVLGGKRQTFTVSGRLRFAPEDCDAWVAAHVVEAVTPSTRATSPKPPALEPLPMPRVRRFS